MTQDMTTGKPTKKILLFALPMFLGNIFQQVYNLVDTIVVGRFVGPDALAAVGSSFTMMTFITSVIIGLCMGAGVLISQLFGAKETVRMQRAISTSFTFILVITLIIMAITLIFIDPILKLFQTPVQIVEDTKTYLTFIFGGLIFTFLYNFATCLLRAIGDSKTPLYALIAACLINVVLDLVFVIVLHLGVMGAALATVIAQAVSALLGCIYAIKKLSFLQIQKENLIFDREMFRTTARYSVLTSVQQSIMNFGILMVQGLVNTFGATAMAAFAAAVKIDSFAYMPVQEFGNAFSTYVAQNVGAEKTDRVKQGVHSAFRTIILFCIVISSVVLIFARQLITIFVSASETAIIDIGAQYLYIVGVFYVLIGFLFMFYGFYRGIGQHSMSIILTILSLGTRVALAYLLAPTPIGLVGIWWAIPIGWAIADLVGFVVYGRGKWTRFVTNYVKHFDKREN